MFTYRYMAIHKYNSEKMKQFIRVMKALSDPSRVRVLKLLQEEQLCVCNIQEFLQLAQSTVSRHMKTLEDAGLVEHERQGTWIIYRLADNHESVYERTMLAHLENWLEDDKELKQMRHKKDQVIANTTLCITKG